MDVERIFAGLNPEQRRAVEAVRGPVCILAGAGSGKTTTITRRIANQVASRVFVAREILAVTFTDKAAAEMRGRLEDLGAEGVTARTFHAAALGQLHAFGEPPKKIVASKALSLRQIANALPKPYRFRPAGDLATEVEWAKNRRLTPETYLDGLGEHRPPIPPDLMKRVFRQYEERKLAAGYADFEDLLERAVRLFEADSHALAELRDRYRAFTVDEYQDVNLLQQTLLERWLGPRDDLCAVGDDYQSIYAFTGATPRYLLELPDRFPHATVVRLESNYRSTSQVLELANRIVPRLGGAEKILRTTRGDGPEATARSFASAEAEAEFDDGERSTSGFVAELERRFGSTGAERRGVHLLTLHGAKGLEFEAVFLPRLQERELPVRQAKTDEEIAEERRLLYVGMTRAKRHLAITWSGRPSRFLSELGVQTAAPRREPEPDDPVYAALKRWRLQRATADELPAYVVFHNTTLAEIAGRQPRDLTELGAVPGVGPTKLERYGKEVLAVLAAR